MRQPRILMCPPDYYGIEYEINPWMSRPRGSTPERAPQQWQHLHETLRRPGRAGRADDAAAGPARPGLHRQRRPGVRQALLQLALPPRGPRPRDAALRRLVRGARLHGRAPAGGDVTSRGPATPCSAARRCSPATASAATCTATSTSARCCSRQVLPLELVNPALLPPRYLLLPAGARRGDLLSRRRSTPTAARCCETHIPRLIAVDEGGGASLRLQRGGGGQDGGHEHRLRPAGGRPARLGLRRRSRWSWTSSSRRAAAPSA